MFKNKMSLRLRIFISMILLVFTATLLVLGSTYYQYRTESDQYNSYRQERKENQLKRQINYIVNKYDISDKYEMWDEYEKDFEEITKIHSVEYSIFTTGGSPLFYSYLPLDVISNNYSLEEEFANMLVSTDEGKFTSENFTDVGKFQASYSVLKNDVGEKYAILFFPYFQDVSFAESELNVFLSTLYQIYFIMLVVAIVLAYFISRYVTRSIETIRLKIGQAGLLKKNEKIYLSNATKEIDSLVNSYNKMIDDLEDSAERLAKTEREQAWQEMAKQVAHEIKNPLTPIQLTIDRIKTKYLNQLDNKDKSNFEENLKIINNQIKQIGSLVNEFSDFARMPKPILKNNDLLQILKENIKLVSELDKDIFINVDTKLKKILFKSDKEQLSRVFFNLLKNSIESIHQKKAKNPGFTKKISIEIAHNNDHIIISITDNGIGFDNFANNIKDILHPYFTTKKNGTGLGLSIVNKIINDHNGKIDFIPINDGAKVNIIFNLNDS